MNKGRNDNLPRICLTEIEGDSTTCKVNRAKCYLELLSHLSTLLSWKLHFPLSWSWSYSTGIFDNGSPCIDLLHQPYFRMLCNAADLKFISFALRFKTPHYVHPVLPSTPCSAPYPWAHELMNHLLVTLLIFSPLWLVCCL